MSATDILEDSILQNGRGRRKWRITMQIPAFLDRHEKNPLSEAEQSSPKLHYKPHLPLKAQEEFHQQQKHCSTGCTAVRHSWGDVKCLQSYLPPLHKLPTDWLDVLPEFPKIRWLSVAQTTAGVATHNSTQPFPWALLSHLPAPNFCPATTCLESWNPPKRELDFDCAVGIWLQQKYKQSWEWHFPEHKSFLFFFCSQLPNEWQELQKQVNNALGEPVHPSHTNLKTLSKQTLEYDQLGAKVKKISSSNNGCREGKTKTSPALHWGANSLSQWLLSHYLHFYIPLVSWAQWILLLNTVKAPRLSEVCQSNTMEQAQPRRKYWCSAWPEGIK